MKIAIDARFWGPKDTGLGRYTLNLVTKLGKIDKANRYFLLVREAGLDREIKPWPKNWQLVKIKSHPYSLLSQVQVTRALLAIKPDVFHVPHIGVPLLFTGRLVLTVHDLIKHHWSQQAGTTRSRLVHLIKLRVYRLNLRLAIKRAKIIIVPSRYVGDQLRRVFPEAGDKIRPIPEGIDPIFWQKFSDPDRILRKYRLIKPWVVYTGNVYPYKNVPTLVEAVALARGKIAGLKLAIVCPRTVFSNRLKTMIRQKNAEAFVRILDFVPDQDLVQLYQRSLAFVSASLEEGFGLAPLEALASGCPAVVSDIPVFREICGPAAFYFKPDDPDQLAAVLVDLAAGRLKAKIKIDPAKFSWPAMAEKIKELYENT